MCVCVYVCIGSLYLLSLSLGALRARNLVVSSELVSVIHLLLCFTALHTRCRRTGWQGVRVCEHTCVCMYVCVYVLVSIVASCFVIDVQLQRCPNEAFKFKTNTQHIPDSPIHAIASCPFIISYFFISLFFFTQVWILLIPSSFVLARHRIIIDFDVVAICSSAASRLHLQRVGEAHS